MSEEKRSVFPRDIHSDLPSEDAFDLSPAWNPAVACCYPLCSIHMNTLPFCKASCNGDAFSCAFHMLLNDTHGTDEKNVKTPSLALSPALCCLEKAQPPEGPSTSSNSSFPESVNINHTAPNFSAFVNGRPDSRMIYQLVLWAIRIDFSASGGLQWVV